MTQLPRIVEATTLDDWWIRLRFTDGLIQEVNLGPVFDRGGPFSPIRDDRSVFDQVRVNPESGTVEWPGQIDLDPDVLYGAHEAEVGEPLERRVIETAR